MIRATEHRCRIVDAAIARGYTDVVITQPGTDHPWFAGIYRGEYVTFPIAGTPSGVNAWRASVRCLQKIADRCDAKHGLDTAAPEKARPTRRERKRRKIAHAKRSVKAVAKPKATTAPMMPAAAAPNPFAEKLAGFKAVAKKTASVKTLPTDTVAKANIIASAEQLAPRLRALVGPGADVTGLAGGLVKIVEALVANKLIPLGAAERLVVGIEFALWAAADFAAASVIDIETER